MSKRRLPRSIGAAHRTIERFLGASARRSRCCPPANDAIGKLPGILSGCTEHREQAGEQLLWRGIEIDPRRLRDKEDRKISAIQPRLKRTLRRPPIVARET